VRHCQFSPDGTLLSTSSDDQLCLIWDARTGRVKQTLRGHSNSVRASSFSADGNQIATASWDRTVKVWAVATGALGNFCALSAN
jgi:WD40 repeat protein